MGKKKFVGQEYTAATNGKGLKEGTAVGRFFTRLTVTFSVMGILASVAIVAFTMFFALAPVIGTSMMKTLNATGANTDNVLINKAAPANRGDIIITKLYGKDTSYGAYDTFNFPQKDKNGNFEYIIKRLIALPGDTVTVALDATESGNLYYIYVNGEKIDEKKYLDPEFGKPSSPNFERLYLALDSGHFVNQSGTMPPCIENGVLTVPAGYWFFMGDNRGGSPNPAFIKSWDCSAFGVQPMEHYMGRGDDVLENKETVAQYLWRKFTYYVFFGWTADL